MAIRPCGNYPLQRAVLLIACWFLLIDTLIVLGSTMSLVNEQKHTEETQKSSVDTAKLPELLKWKAPDIHIQRVLQLPFLMFVMCEVLHVMFVFFDAALIVGVLTDNAGLFFVVFLSILARVAFQFLCALLIALDVERGDVTAGALVLCALLIASEFYFLAVLIAARKDMRETPHMEFDSSQHSRPSAFKF